MITQMRPNKGVILKPSLFANRLSAGLGSMLESIVDQCRGRMSMGQMASGVALLERDASQNSTDQMSMENGRWLLAAICLCTKLSFSLVVLPDERSIPTTGAYS